MWIRLTDRMRKFIPKVRCCMLKRTGFIILIDDELGGLDMVTTDEDPVLLGD